MNFRKAVDNWCSEHSNKELAELVGCNSSSISEYRDGSEPKPERKKLISEIIGYNEKAEPKFKQEVEYVSYEEATTRLGISEYLLKIGLQRGVFPFGVAFKGKREQYNYLIFRRQFEKFIEENKWPQ